MEQDLELDRLGLAFGGSVSVDGRAWLERLPGLVASLRADWGLRRIGRPYAGGSGAWVAPVELDSGERAVLKVGFPHREARAEAYGLRRWGGNGAVRLLRQDAERTAYLLELCEPGTKLVDASELGAEARLRIGAGLLRRLWLPVETVDAGETDAPPSPESVGEQMGWWADMAEERLALLPAEADAGLVRTCLDLLRTLPASVPASRSVLLHGDFNPGNVLSAAREPWLAIDAKPLAGDPAFDPWPLLEQVDPPFALPRPGAVLTARGALLGDELGVDPLRIFAWGAARRAEAAVAIAADEPDECLRILAEQTRTLADLAGL
ncbi:phosphotransferase [Actinospica durhamensis]|uniref:Phosphotransferase n=1 Tax=Actinospica durhamensis TaxID=1508375 RepID=A0A941IV67_9ACTN|nr:aminoglycoside phosphotransferase family protein [Actinospica durhamensis]MBR7838648.1 phosphotransferase [Actinospica durhamensis]